MYQLNDDGPLANEQILNQKTIKLCKQAVTQHWPNLQIR